MVDIYKKKKILMASKNTDTPFSAHPIQIQKKPPSLPLQKKKN